jgi:hypothetical protein
MDAEKSRYKSRHVTTGLSKCDSESTRNELKADRLCAGLIEVALQILYKLIYVSNSPIALWDQNGENPCHVFRDILTSGAQGGTIFFVSLLSALGYSHPRVEHTQTMARHEGRRCVLGVHCCSAHDGGDSPCLVDATNRYSGYWQSVLWTVHHRA